MYKYIYINHNLTFVRFPQHIHMIEDITFGKERYNTDKKYKQIEKRGKNDYRFTFLKKKKMILPVSSVCIGILNRIKCLRVSQ